MLAHCLRDPALAPSLALSPATRSLPQPLPHRPSSSLSNPPWSVLGAWSPGSRRSHGLTCNPPSPYPPAPSTDSPYPSNPHAALRGALCDLRPRRSSLTPMDPTASLSQYTHNHKQRRSRTFRTLAIFTAMQSLAPSMASVNGRTD